MNNDCKRSNSQRQEVSVFLRRDPVVGFCWEVSTDTSHKGTSGAAGFESLQEMFSDIDFLRMLQKNLGSDSVPEYAIEQALTREVQNRMPIDDDIVAALKGEFGPLVEDNRQSEKKK